MLLRIGFVFALLCACYVVFKEPIKRWLREKNPFPGYDPLNTDVRITYNEDDLAAQRLAFQLHSYLEKHGMDAVPFPVATSSRLPEADPNTVSNPGVNAAGVEIHINRSN